MSRLKYIMSRFKFNFNKYIRRENFVNDKSVQEIVHQINEYGYAVVPNFYSLEECKILRKETDRLLLEYEEKGELWVDAEGADKRAYLANENSELINKFYTNKFLLSVAENYFKGKMVVLQTLAAKISFNPKNIGSGGGWHRDGNFFQFKAIVYLSDVNEKNGPFQIIEKSHFPKYIVEDTQAMNKIFLDVRMSNKEIERLLKKDPKRYKMLTATAGTLIFADVSTIHTGKIIDEGERYALFNYFYPSYDNIEKRKHNFTNIYKKQSEYA